MNITNLQPITAKLRTKNGRYYAVFYCAGINGKPKEIWRTLDLEDKPGNKRTALERMEKMKNRLNGIINTGGYDIAFVEYLSSWAEKKKGEVEESTYCSIRRYTENKIIKYFMPLKLSLSEVMPRHIQRFYEYLYKYGRTDGSGGLSISTIKSIKSILNEVFKTAIIDGLLVNNPVESVKLPAKDNPRKPHTVLTKEAANRLLGSVMDDDLMYPLLLITLRYGLRRSEVLGLKWSAIDLQNKTLRIESVITTETAPEKNRTKTATSNAAFPLFPEITEALAIRKQAQERDRAAMGTEYTETGYVFTYEDGRHLIPDRVTKKFKKILEECGLPDMRFHDLRHSTACILFENGMKIKELQQWMRHGKIEMTADVYLHISKEREAELANGLQNMLSAASGSEDSRKEILQMA